MNVICLLLEARKLLTMGWCHKALAKDFYGKTCLATGPEACLWCLIGSLIRARFNLNLNYQTYSDAYKVLAKRVNDGTYGLGAYNDAQVSVNPILALIDEVIEELRSCPAS